jgi:hypothetical protein
MLKKYNKVYEKIEILCYNKCYNKISVKFYLFAFEVINILGRSEDRNYSQRHGKEGK